VKPKKVHEVQRLTKFIDFGCSKVGLKTIVDIGAGEVKKNKQT